MPLKRIFQKTTLITRAQKIKNETHHHARKTFKKKNASMEADGEELSSHFYFH